MSAKSSKIMGFIHKMDLGLLCLINISSRAQKIVSLNPYSTELKMVWTHSVSMAVEWSENALCLSVLVPYVHEYMNLNFKHPVNDCCIWCGNISNLEEEETKTKLMF